MEKIAVRISQSTRRYLMQKYGEYLKVCASNMCKGWKGKQIKSNQTKIHLIVYCDAVGRQTRSGQNAQNQARKVRILTRFCEIMAETKKKNIKIKLCVSWAQIELILWMKCSKKTITSQKKSPSFARKIPLPPIRPAHLILLLCQESLFCPQITDAMNRDGFVCLSFD